MRWYHLVVLQAVTVSFLVSCTTPEGDLSHYEIVISDGRIIDPESGLDDIRNVGIRAGQVVAVTEEALEGVSTIDATGLVVAPGFIDLHQHGQTEEAYAFSVQDGVTTSFELESGTDDVDRWYADRGDGQIVNHGVSIGHIPVRMTIMGDEGIWLPSGPGGHEVASDSQITEMARRIEEGLNEGAVAVGFGFAYTPAATESELEMMLRVAAAHGATAFVHVRDALEGSVEGLGEAIEMVQRTQTSLHVVHANSSGGAVTSQFLADIHAARDAGVDITTEAYPYGAGMTAIASALFDDWESWPDERFGDFQWAASGERLTRQTFADYRQEDGIVIMHVRTEDLTRAALTDPITMIASDGLLEDGRGHPRASGTYARVLGRYVRQEGALALADALRKMTIEPARRLEARVPAMRNKGRIGPGADADITVFNPETVIDRSTYTDPAVPSEGIEYVLVNGVVVVEHGELLEGVRPGRAIRAGTE
jgi:N-acyl-D-aspartate/D-glutamate deacylase